jgi:hypothetical protein
MVGILLVGTFSHLFFTIKEERTMGKRFPVQTSAFTGLSLATDHTPGEPTITIGKGWFERKRAGLFVIGGFQRLILDRVTITIPQKMEASATPSESVINLLPREFSMESIVLAEVRRLEFREPKEQGGEAFLRVALADVPAGKNKPIVLQNAWFREKGKAWEQLARAWIERKGEPIHATLHLIWQNGEQKRMPLTITL